MAWCLSDLLSLSISHFSGKKVSVIALGILTYINSHGNGKRRGPYPREIPSFIDLIGQTTAIV